jgi:hypothetical protein
MPMTLDMNDLPWPYCDIYDELLVYHNEGDGRY